MKSLNILNKTLLVLFFIFISITEKIYANYCPSAKKSQEWVFKKLPPIGSSAFSRARIRSLFITNRDIIWCESKVKRGQVIKGPAFPKI